MNNYYKNMMTISLFEKPKFQAMLADQFNHSVTHHISQVYDALENMIFLDHMSDPQKTADVYQVIAHRIKDLRQRLSYSLPSDHIEETVDAIVSEILECLSGAGRDSDFAASTY